MTDDGHLSIKVHARIDLLLNSKEVEILVLRHTLFDARPRSVLVNRQQQASHRLHIEIRKESARLFERYYPIEGLCRIKPLDDMGNVLCSYEVCDGINDLQPDFAGVLLYGECRCFARREPRFG